MRYDFTDIAYIIPIRVDTEDRIKNLNSLISLLSITTTRPYFIIINDDSSPDKEHLKKIKWKYTDFCDIYFLENKKPFNRSLCFNKGFEIMERNNIKRDCIVCGDTDVFIKPEFIFEGYRNIKQNNIKCVFPNNGFFIDVKGSPKENFLSNLDFKILEKELPDFSELKMLYNKNNITVMHNNYKSGCVMFSTSSYKNINGYNPNFWGWGYEDDELVLRMEKLNIKYLRNNNNLAIAWHMSHPGTIKAANPFYQYNHDLCAKVQEMSSDDVARYITSWKI